MEEFFEKENCPVHLDDSHLSFLELDVKAYMRLLGAKFKALVNEKNLDDYHEILDPRIVLDILDSKFMVVARSIIESGQLFERPSNFKSYF